MTLLILFFILGLAALIGGARLLVSGASGLALLLKLSPLVVGLTIVSFGTSAPEIAVSVLAAWRDNSGLVIGNVVGSNIFNILLALGVAATLSPLIVQKQLIWWDVPLMIGVSIFVWLLSFGGTFSRWEGGLLFLGIVLYTGYAIWKGRKVKEQTQEVSGPLWIQIVFVLGGLILLILGAEVMVRTAEKIARTLGVSDLVIGLTIVAIGTSLPELATTIAAIHKGKKDLAVGNVIGSNLFNLLAVLGLSILVAPKNLSVPPTAIQFDFPIMIAVAIACLPIFLTGHKISRWEGVVFLFYYALYLTYQILMGVKREWLDEFTAALFFFVIPLTLLTLVISLARHFRRSL